MESLKNNSKIQITLKNGFTFETIIKLSKQLDDNLKVVNGFFFEYSGRPYFLPINKKVLSTIKIID